MKKIIILSLILFSSFGFIQGQNEVDALRYSQSFITGTARSVSMGSAFGALGGNFTGVSINPAGIGVYRGSEFSITPSFSYNLGTSDYNNYLYEDFKYDFALSNISLVGTIKSNSKSAWKYTSFGFGYNRTNNFNMNIAIKDPNSTSSLLDEWVSDANNGVWSNFGNSLGNAADLIFENPNSQTWESDFTGSDYGQYQSRTVTSKGSMGEYVFALGGNYNDMLYIGGSFSINSIRYEEQTNHRENDIPEEIEYLNSFTYRNYLETRGTGAGFKLGAIVKPVSWVRLGMAIHSPIFYSLKDEYGSYLSANLTYDNGDPESINGAFDYEIVTPFKAIPSVAFILGKSAIISIDYEFVDYTKSRLRSGGNGYDFDIENGNIQQIYTATNNIRVGGEFRFGPISFRGGYAYYGSPYSSDELNANSDYTIYSGGIGINNNKFYFDLGYSYSTNNQKYVMYHYAAEPAIASVDYNANQIMATLGIRF